MRTCGGGSESEVQVAHSHTNLISLLMVYLTENYEHKSASCEECRSLKPSFAKTFSIRGKWICIDCVIERINGNMHHNRVFANLK
jgi:hypothetical protein